MFESLKLEDISAALRGLGLQLPSLPEGFSRESLIWAAFCPAWPEQLARRGFALDSSRIATGDDVTQLLEQMEDRELLERMPGEAPWRGTWYSMPSSRRSAVLDSIRRDGSTLLIRELQQIGLTLIKSGEGRLPPALERFATLARDAGGPIGRVLDDKVIEALASAEEKQQISCPEALRWIEAAEAVARYLPGDLELALGRARRRHELFLRRSRDARYLRNYMPRPHLERAFLDLLDDSAADSWALHYLGDGGMGKTMLVRRITGQFAREHNLVTSRIDFDYVNPDYPERAPGLLLQILADDLRLDDDERVQTLLQKFTDAIEAVHRRIEGQSDSGSQETVLLNEGLLEEPIYNFIDALRVVSERGRRPVLILDTCEELTRLRPTGEVPRAVVRTFELLERLHKDVPSLRVVFSGRRPLTRLGRNFTSTQTQLDPRPYLRVARVSGFDDQEADAFLEHFTDEHRHVAPGVREGIKAQSRVEGHRAATQPASPETGPDTPQRYNPYDLDVYARWIAGAGTDEEQSRMQAMFASGAHLYVRERIVLRASPFVQPWLPVLALLGHFDREVLELIAGGGESQFADLFNELTSQEWVDLERGALWSGGLGDGERTWVADRNVRARIHAYYRDQEPDACRSARAKLRRVLQRITLERPWSRLTPGYFTLCFDLLSDTPDELARWWNAVVRKIVDGGAWAWAGQVIDALPLDASEEDEVDYPAACEALRGPMKAAVYAARAAVDRHNGRTSELRSTWATVLSALEAHPLAEEQPPLAYRARVGTISAARYSSVPITEVSIDAVADALGRVPAMPVPADAEAAREMRGTAVALVEDMLEILEQIEWQNEPPRTLLEMLDARLRDIEVRLDPELLAVCAMLRARLSRLGERAWLEDDLATAAELQQRLAGSNPLFLDWVCPADLGNRLLLEMRRLARDTGPEIRRALRDASDLTHDFATLDGERAAAAALLLASDQQLPADPPDTLIASSLAIDSTQKPECCGHRLVPPYFQIALTVRAERGEVDRAVQQCRRISHDSQRPLSTRQAADRALAAITARWRLRDLDFARETTIHQSASAQDRTLVADMDWLDHRSRRLTGRTVAEGSLAQASRFDRPLQYRRAIRTSTGDALPVTQLGRRHAARLLLVEGTLRAMVDPASTVLLSNAARLFEEADDPVGEWHAWTTDALAAATVKDKQRLARSVAAAGRALQEAVGRGLCTTPQGVARQSMPIARTGPERALLSQSLATPWLFRTLASRVRLDEFDAAGEESTALVAWGADNFGGIPRDCRDVLLISGAAESAAAAAPAPPTVSEQAAAAATTIGDAQVLSSAGGLVSRAIALGAGLLAIVAVVAIAYVSVLALYWVHTRVIGLVYGDVTRTTNVATFVAVLLVLGALVASARVIGGAAARLVLGWVTLTYVIVPDRDEVPGSVATASVRSNVRLVVGVSPWFLARPRQAIEEGPDRTRVTYGQRAARAGSATSTRLTRTLLRVVNQSVPLDLELSVAAQCAAEPWEALIANSHLDQARSTGRFRFRRTRAAATNPFTQARDTGRAPWPAHPRAFIDASIDRALASGNLPRMSASLAKLQSAGYDPRLTLLSERVTSLLEPDPTVSVVIGIAEAVLADSGLMLQFENQVRMFPADIARLCPAVRLLVMFAPPRHTPQRLGSDALDASRQRQAASVLHHSGIPAVLAIPPITPPEVYRVLQRVVDLLAEHPPEATPALMELARQVRTAIASRTSTSTASPPSAADLDASFDVCLYCADHLDLRIPRISSLPSATGQAASERVAAR